MSSVQRKEGLLALSYHVMSPLMCSFKDGNAYGTNQFMPVLKRSEYEIQKRN